MIVVSELVNDAIRTGFLFCMGIAMVRITSRSKLARFTLLAIGDFNTKLLILKSTDINNHALILRVCVRE